MSKKLQIEIDVDATGDGKPEIAVTPVDVVLPDTSVAAIEQAIALAGGSGNELDVKDHIAVPVRFWILKTNVELNATVKIRVKDTGAGK